METRFRKLLISERGLSAHVAREAGVKRAAVSKWSKRGIPAERVLDVERITGIPREQLRPDIYPPCDGGGQEAA